jgi:hypothetical protein
MKMKFKPFLVAFCLSNLLFACREKKPDPPADGQAAGPQAMVTTPPPIAGNAYSNLDISPMDMSYFPVDYPKLKMTSSTIDPPVARVIYSRPHLAKRHLFRDLLKYDEPWRLGANEATEIDFYKTVTIDGKQVAQGRYIIYAIPHPDKWTFVLNSNIDSWGLSQDTKKDILRVAVPISTGNPPQEYFTMIFEKRNNGADLVVSWDDLVTKLPITF